MTRSRSACVLVAGLMVLLATARGEFPLLSPDAARSVSGQFIISVTPNNFRYFRRPEAATNADILRLEAPWLAVSAERFKAALGRELDLPARAQWSGKIFIALHTARSLDEPVLIASQPFINVWNYRLELPDLIHRDRYARAVTAVLLLEFANRNNPVAGRSAEIPAWLVDGLARQVTEADDARVILSAPNKTVDGFAQTRLDEKRRGLDSLAVSRRVLQNFRALTFDQLSWPDNDQLNGDDDGVYLASAQLFVSELLNLKNGPAKVQALLRQLPTCQNWQAAFYVAFRDNFQSPLEVEKWWALRVVTFATRAPGPQWTLAVSREKLNAILSVPVEIRSASNDLPSRAEITLQAAIQNFEPSQQSDILQTKLRDLDLIQLRLASPLAALADGYRSVLADFLGGRKRNASVKSGTKRPAPVRHSKAEMATMVNKLDALDERRYEVEAKLNSKALRLPTQ